MVVVAALSQVPISWARADDAEPAAGWREVWAGADVSSDVWLVYSGMTVAPWGQIHSDGVRFRGAGGYGEYTYLSRTATNELRSYSARTYFTDVLVGYQKQFGELTAKAFIGGAVISHNITPIDEQTVAIGAEYGVKGAVELWLNIGEKGWASLDASWTTAHDTRAARMRAGYRFWPQVSLGLEAGVNVDAQGECRMSDTVADGCKAGYDRDAANLLDYGRGGAFARYEWASGEISLSAGVLGGSFKGEAASDVDPYATVNWLTQF